MTIISNGVERRLQRLDTMPDKEGNDAETGQDTRKRRRTTRGSQTDDEPPNSVESNPSSNMAATLAEINSKLDLALARIKELEELKEKQRLMEKENSDLRESLEFAYKSIAPLTERADTQQKTLSQLTVDVNKLTQVATVEKECAIKLESHSRWNNLIFYNIPEARQESSATTETLLYTFLEQKLDMAEEETNEISIERAHRLGKIREDKKPRPIIAKFSFHKDKERILSSARALAGTNYGISQDFPREIVEIRKGLVKVMRETKKKGQETKLVYDKL